MGATKLYPVSLSAKRGAASTILRLCYVAARDRTHWMTVHHLLLGHSSCQKFENRNVFGSDLPGEETQDFLHVNPTHYRVANKAGLYNYTFISTSFMSRDHRLPMTKTYKVCNVHAYHSDENQSDHLNGCS